jgi:hypothetical protein
MAVWLVETRRQVSFLSTVRGHSRSQSWFCLGRVPPLPLYSTEPELKNRIHPKKSTPHNSRTGYSPELSKSALDSPRGNLRWQSNGLLWINTRECNGGLKSVFWLQN